VPVNHMLLLGLSSVSFEKQSYSQSFLLALMIRHLTQDIHRVTMISFKWNQHDAVRDKYFAKQ